MSTKVNARKAESEDNTASKRSKKEEKVRWGV